MVFSIYPSTSIDFTVLISALSTLTHSRSSIKVRNRLLSPWTVPPLPKLSSSTVTKLAEHSSNPSSTSNLSSLLLSEVQADPDPWSTFKKHQPGIEIYLFGHPPNDVLNAASHSSSSNSNSNVSNLWSVLIFSPALPMPDRKSGPRIDLWLSSQSLLPSGSASDQSRSDTQVSTSEQDLLHFIMNDWLAERLRSSANHQGQRSLEKSGQSFEEVSFTLCGIEQRICDLLTQWSGLGEENETGKVRKLLDYEVEWSGAYVSYSKESNTDDLNQMILRDIKEEEGETLDLIEGRWKLESIEEEDLDLVRSTNKLPFPLEYVKSHLSHSIMLRDAKGSTVEGQEIGKPAGWLYNHDDLALASLHVPQNYRRIVSTFESPVKGKGKGIGTILMDLITPRVALVQEYALKKSGNARLLERLRDGNEAILTPCVAVTEVGNVPARLLFEKCGFVEEEKVAWVGMRLRE